MKVKNYQEENKQRFLDELFELLRIPSISANSNYQDRVIECANAFADNLKKSGFKNVEVFPTKGNPVVYGEFIKDKNIPTVLIYGHYDVQPVDPINLWDSDPFEPIIKKTDIHPQGAIFARGSADDKGQVFMHIKAVESMIQMDELPCNVKIIIEGEEEVGSVNLEEFLQKNKEKLTNDVILISDTHMFSNETPTITTGVRGLSYMEVCVESSTRDLHSGLYGGAVPDPISVLSKMIESLIDAQGKITIKGFYDKVIELSPEEREGINKLPFNEEIFKKSIGIREITGERGYTPLERLAIRPCLNVNGIWGGYIEEGAKTVIPAKAYAKISMRLVPDQDSKEISDLFKDYFLSLAPESIKVTVNYHHGGNAYVLPSNDSAYLAAKKAMEKTFSKEALPFRSGGSIPIIPLFEKHLNVKSVLMGFGLDTDAIHSPNEHYGLFNFYKGIETIPYFFKYYRELK